MTTAPSTQYIIGPLAGNGAGHGWAVFAGNAMSPPKILGTFEDRTHSVSPYSAYERAQLFIRALELADLGAPIVEDLEEVPS